MRRQIWLKNPETGAIWNLLPDNPYDVDGGVSMLKIAGTGYEQGVTQEQVEIDYFISQIKSKNQSITGTFYFNGDEHIRNFQQWVGDFRKQFLLYYAPDGEYEPYDQISSPYYKPVTISSVKKTEKDEYGWYECAVTFSTQADVWKRNIYYSIKGALENVGEALVYPYTYEYVMGGRDIYAIEIPNDGRETGCQITIRNKSDTPISQLEWFIENTVVDYYGNEQTTVQRSKWFTTNTDVTLDKNYELYVDSNPVTQEAKVNYPDGTSQSIVAWQEPSWEYINFVQIKNGKNRIVFYVENPDVDITVAYQEQKELI